MARRYALLLLLAVAAPIPLAAGTIMLDFEGFPDSTVLTTQYFGVTFTNTVILTAGISLNEFDYPPHSGVSVVSDSGGPMTINFANPILSFSGWFTYAEPLALAAFDAGSNQVTSTASLFSANYVSSGNPPNEFLQVSFAGGISSVTITGDPLGGSFTLDDATITTAAASVPEPSNIILLPSALVGMALVALRRRHTQPYRL